MTNHNYPRPHESAAESGTSGEEPASRPNSKPPEPVEPERDIGETSREYEHSSGDRNTRTDDDDWPTYRGGTQRNADPSGATDSDPDKH